MAVLLAPAAEAEWLPPVDISEPAEHAGQPHVALDSAGNATAVWDRWDGTATVVETAYRPAGAPWGEPEVLSPPDSMAPKVVVDRNGVLTAVWERRTGVNHFAIESVTRMPGQEWSEPVEVTDFEQGSDPEPWLAVDWEGNATVVWKQGEVVMSSFRGFLHAWGEPIPLSPGESFTPQTAMDARGDATAVWMHFDGSRYVVESSYRPEQGEWGAATLVSQPGEEGGNPHVAVDGNGHSLVVWRGEDEGEEFVRAAFRPAGAEWSEPVNVSNEGEQVQSLRAAIDPEGNAIVAWSGNGLAEGEFDTVRAAFKPAEQGWQEPVDLSAGGNGFPNDVVFDQSGNAAIVWQRWDGVTNLVQAAYRPVGGEWEEPVDLSEEGKQGMDSVVVLDAPGSATAADGDATAIWVSASPVACEGTKEPPCNTYVVQAAGYDPDGLPEVEVEAPAEGEVGEEIEISTPTEGLFSPEIEFGDGEAFAGTEATHVYDEPGEYLVRAAGAEELGYQGFALHTITITGEGEGEPDPGEEGPGPEEGGGPSGGGETQNPTPSRAPQVLPAAPSQACLAATGAREAIVARLQKLKSKLEHAQGPRAHRRLAAAKRRQLASLRRVRARVAASC
jgi:hypothetical protein